MSTPVPHAVKARSVAGPHAAKTARAKRLPVIFVSGHGWGHGVGLAQYGAYGYALHGWTWDKILAHYYPGTTIGPAPVSKVRVLLAAGATRAAISSASPFTVTDGAGKVHKLAAGKQSIGLGLKLRLVPSKPVKALTGPLLFAPGTTPLSLGSRAYRGSLRVKVAGSALQVVNVVGLESYLRGVVGSEMPDRWPAEALAAQAVAARTFALAERSTSGDFDLYPDTRSQVYGGIAAESKSATGAVTETAGQVVLYDDEPALTYFSSSSGGRTANVQDVFPSSKPVPYLVSVADPYDTLSPYHNWGPLRYGASKLARRLGVPGSIVDYRANVSPSGRVRTVTLTGTKGERTVRGSSVRAVLGLRSTWFRLGLLNLANPTGAVVYGAAVKLAGTARGVQKIYLDSRPYGGKWKRLGRVVAKSGALAPSVAPKVTTDYRLESGGFASSVVRVGVAPLVKLSAGTDGISLTGQAKPLVSGAVVQVQRMGPSGWETVSSTTVDARGTFSAQLDLSAGSYRARIVAGHGFAIGFSNTLTVANP
ncbi:MAG TPA: SpoIID/LytB domain-containing protein [Gaiellaceae bacterium]|nr:SpoIID/LytB domain-containing protein [Gaiellaceae bacterium]